MVIDDLADRPHDCDLLLDQNLGRKSSDYSGLVPQSCQTLIGPQYALLRPEFAELRPYSLARRMFPQLRRLLIAMGGVDKDNATGKVLEALKGCSLPEEFCIKVVMGPYAPWLRQVRDQASQLPWNTEVLVNVRGMAGLMADSDLAIGAAGTTAWERCCLGLPTLTLVLAENQRGVATSLESSGSISLIKAAGDLKHDLKNAIRQCLLPGHLIAMQHACCSITDGLGIVRFLSILMNFDDGDRRIRAMTINDLDLVRAWRNHPKIRRYMLTQHEISIDEHRKWFERSSHDLSKRLLIFEEKHAPLGFVQFSGVTPGGIADWGFYTAPDSPKGTGKKLGRAALKFAFHTLGLLKVCGQALASNDASIHFHRELGFKQEAVLRKQHQINGNYQDLICFGLLCSGWSEIE
jgi:UDP-4-amino-4,6-dideoxy-N-acetyl-beta-L-altrosamine N-acetyltransferase